MPREALSVLGKGSGWGFRTDSSWVSLSVSSSSQSVSRVLQYTSSRLQVWGHGGVERVVPEGSVASCVCFPVLVPSAYSALDMEGLDLDSVSLTFPRKWIGHKEGTSRVTGTAVSCHQKHP